MQCFEIYTFEGATIGIEKVNFGNLKKENDFKGIGCDQIEMREIN
jgi:hypothetical protein